jgi:hypothetical protein
MKSRQRGEFLMARALLLVLILLAMLIIPVWIKRGNDDKMNASTKAEQAQQTGQAKSTGTPSENVVTTGGAPVASMAESGAAAANGQNASTESTSVPAVPRPIGHGLTFALAPTESGGGGGSTAAELANLTHLSCHGEPRQVDQPHRDSCNPYKGDTSCRVVLPVLCFQGKGLPQPAGIDAGQYKGWSGGVLGATQPVMGAILTSNAAGTARCEKELGAGWRMAEFHDAGGWGMQGQRGLGLAPNTRFWVHINDQPGNCWDSKP